MRTALAVFAVFFVGCGPASAVPSDAPIPLAFYELAAECEPTCRVDGTVDCTASPGCADAIVACASGGPPDYSPDMLTCEGGDPDCSPDDFADVVCHRPTAFTDR